MKALFTRSMSILRNFTLKRLPVVLPVACAYWLLSDYVGLEPYAVVAVFLGFISAMIADVIYLSKEKRSALMLCAWKFTKNHAISLFEYGFKLFIICIFLGMSETPKEPDIAEIQKYVKVFGLLAIYCYPLIYVFTHKLTLADRPHLLHVFNRFILAMIFYSVVLWLIGLFGSDIKNWVIVHPDEAIVLAVSFILVSLILKPFFSSASISTPGVGIGVATGFSAQIKPSITLTEQDRRYACAHEAGHALVYAALGRLPPGMEVVVCDQDKGVGSLGHVSALMSSHQLNDKVYFDWKMHVYLAGQMGEMIAFGKNTIGAAGDLSRWLDIARAYHSNHFEGIFYNDPKNKMEQEANEAKLYLLKQKQKDMLAQLFQVNEAVFNDLRESLFEKKVITKEDLLPLLSRVVLPEGFPLPIGSFEQFSEDWPEKFGFYTDKDGRLIK